MSEQCLKDVGWWEEYFSAGGGWEANGGRAQTRIFAENFTARVKLDPGASFSILDAGCALGDALAHFASVYPNASLHGIDFSATAISRCKAELGDRVTVSTGDLEDIRGHYDVIYCSNTLEHFTDFDQRARKLARHCNRLCILVPFQEFDREGRALRPSSTEHHQHTFQCDTFDFLVKEGVAVSVDTEIFSCPGAWGWNAKTAALQAMKNLGRRLTGRRLRLAPRQILFDISIAR